MDKYKQVEQTNKKTIFINNFIGGISFALGSTVGLAIVIALVSFILGQINLIPFFGSYVAEINKFIITHPK